MPSMSHFSLHTSFMIAWHQLFLSSQQYSAGNGSSAHCTSGDAGPVGSIQHHSPSCTALDTLSHPGCHCVGSSPILRTGPSLSLSRHARDHLPVVFTLVFPGFGAGATAVLCMSTLHLSTKSSRPMVWNTISMPIIYSCTIHSVRMR